MILTRFDAVASITAFWLVKSHEGNTLHKNGRLRACLQLSMTVECLISIHVHRDYMDMNRTSRCIRNPWASELLRVNNDLFCDLSVLLSGHCIFRLAANATQGNHYAYSIEHPHHRNIWSHDPSSVCCFNYAEISG